MILHIHYDVVKPLLFLYVTIQAAIKNFVPGMRNERWWKVGGSAGSIPTPPPHLYWWGTESYSISYYNHLLAVDNHDWHYLTISHLLCDHW